MNRIEAAISLSGVTVSEAAAISQELEATLTGEQLRRVILGLRTVEGVLSARRGVSERRERAAAGVSTSYVWGWGKCSGRSCEVVPRSCVCKASWECVVCHTIKCEGKHD